jgi:hypothetical protein
MEYNGSFILAVRVEGSDRQSFFAIAKAETASTVLGSGIIRS